MPDIHHLTEDVAHCRWDRSIPPALEIDPGDTVVFETPEAVGGQIQPGTPASALLSLNFDLIHQINGPVLVRGAEPGDALIVEIIDIKPKEWAWTAIIPAFGLLQDDVEFHNPYIHIWDLTSGSYAEFKTGIRVPFEPFCGVMGVAQAEAGELITAPPRINGGNIDTKQAVPGATVFLPVLAPGALFSLGDVHAAQGDGEVCGSAIECQATVTARFDVMKGHPLPEVAIQMPGAMTGSWNTAGWMVTTAHGSDLMESAKQAVRYMIEYLQRSHGLSAQEAYVLCSACGDLKIAEIVDAPNWIVTMSFPLGVFSKPQAG